jgi:hypothetical protein
LQIAAVDHDRAREAARPLSMIRLQAAVFIGMAPFVPAASTTD